MKNINNEHIWSLPFPYKLYHNYSVFRIGSYTQKAPTSGLEAEDSKGC